MIGLDPGIERTGYALVYLEGHAIQAREYGCITTSPQLSLSERLVELKRDLDSLLAKYKPAGAVVERLVFVHNVTSAIAVGQARGVIMLALQEHGVAVSEYSPSEVKQAVTSNGAADKAAVGQAVRLIYGLKEVPQPDDAADALALAVCHAGRVQ